jgi:hypothetical protein
MFLRGTLWGTLLEKRFIFFEIWGTLSEYSGDTPKNSYPQKKRSLNL